MCLETHKIGELVAQVTDAVLDLFDVTLDFSPGQNEWAVQHTTFALPLLLGEDSEAHLQQPLQTVVASDSSTRAHRCYTRCVTTRTSDALRAARASRRARASGSIATATAVSVHTSLPGTDAARHTVHALRSIGTAITN